MRILIAVHHFPPRYLGGAEWRAHRTATALMARGYTVRVVSVERIDSGPPDGVAWQDDIFQGVAVRRLSFNLAAAPDRNRWEYDNDWIGAHLRELLQDYRPDVFHVISGYLITGRALRVAQELGIPTVVTLTDFWFLCQRISMWRSNGQLSMLPIDPATCAQCIGEEQRRYRWLGKWFPELMRRYWRGQRAATRRLEARLDFLMQTLNQVEAIISPSQFLRSMFVEAGVAPERIIFSRQGRDLPRSAAAPTRALRRSELRLGYLGQIAELKGVHVLFEAARLLREAPLTVQAYGDPALFPAYASRLKQLIAGDSRLRLAGAYQGAKELEKILAELDVIVMPSVWYENSPNVILEAFAHGVPVIASALGGMAELVQHGKNGLHFIPGDAADLARQIQRLLTEPDLLTELRAGIEPIRSAAEEMQELEAIYQRVTRRPEAAVIQ
ncbi:MAG: glycosyltransferase family 4 protein [Anaerolineales bacterium]